jgi:hypothetical protein
MSVIRLATSSPICSHHELAALDFEPDQHFVNFGKNPEAQEQHEERLRSVCIGSRFAMAILGRTKTEMIESIRALDVDQDDEANSMTFLQYMTDTREKLEALLAFVTSAEVRHACAMANAYPDEKEKQPPIPKPPAEPTIGRRKRK